MEKRLRGRTLSQLWVVDGIPQPLLGCQQEVLHCCLFLINLIPLQYLLVCA